MEEREPSVCNNSGSSLHNQNYGAWINFAVPINVPSLPLPDKSFAVPVVKSHNASIGVSKFAFSIVNYSLLWTALTLLYPTSTFDILHSK